MYIFQSDFLFKYFPSNCDKTQFFFCFTYYVLYSEFEVMVHIDQVDQVELDLVLQLQPQLTETGK